MSAIVIARSGRQKKTCISGSVMSETLRTQLRAFSVRFRNITSDWRHECIPNLLGGFERGITKKKSFERYYRGQEDNIKWEFEKQVVNVLLGLNCVSKCKAHCPAVLEDSGKTSGVLTRSVPVDCWRNSGVEVTGMGWVGLFIWLVGWWQWFYWYSPNKAALDLLLCDQHHAWLNESGSCFA